MKLVPQKSMINYPCCTSLAGSIRHDCSIRQTRVNWGRYLRRARIAGRALLKVLKILMVFLEGCLILSLSFSSVPTDLQPELRIDSLTFQYVAQNTENDRKLVRSSFSTRTTPASQMMQLCSRALLHHGQYKTVQAPMSVFALCVPVRFLLSFQTAHDKLTVPLSVS